MRIATAAVRLLLSALVLATSVDALAQRTMYRCSREGSTYLSDRPCEGRPATGLGAMGPARQARASYGTGDPSVEKASDYLAYLTPLCAELNEGMRNGGARGLGARAMNELRTCYRERCGEDEQEARKKLAEEQRRKRELRDRDLAAEKSENDRVKLSREQCDEMYRIASIKRKTLGAMSAGERADFERFEANWKARCPA